jgi:hypothetical protein
VTETVSPIIAEAIKQQSLPAEIRIDADKLYIDYDAMSSGSGYVAPSVMLEFGARSTGEPASLRDVACDADGLVDGVEFPTARPKVMHAERTSAISHRELANAVAKHKSMFFAEKAADRSPIAYDEAVKGKLLLTPKGDGQKALKEDYSRMVDDGLLLDDAEPFDELLEQCARISEKANSAA